MRKINANELYTACEKTVESWDMETLTAYAVESMYDSASGRPFALIAKAEGWFHTSADSVADATATEQNYDDCFSRELEIVEVVR